MPSWFWTKRRKAISPFGGLASFISFLGQIGFARPVQQHLPLAEPTSPNAIPLAQALAAFPMSVVVGARRFAHCGWLRAGRVLHALPGLERFPSDDAIRNFFPRFSQAHMEAFWRPLWRWLPRLLKCPSGGFALDLDSMVFFCREGQQEGARKGRNSHHPLPAGLTGSACNRSLPRSRRSGRFCSRSTCLSLYQTPDHARRAVSAARNVARDGVPVRCGACWAATQGSSSRQRGVDCANINRW